MGGAETGPGASRPGRNVVTPRLRIVLLDYVQTASTTPPITKSGIAGPDGRDGRGAANSSEDAVIGFVLCTAATRASGAGRFKRLLDVGEREYFRRLPSAAPAAQLPPTASTMGRRRTNANGGFAASVRAAYQRLWVVSANGKLELGGRKLSSN